MASAESPHLRKQRAATCRCHCVGDGTERVMLSGWNFSGTKGIASRFASNEMRKHIFRIARRCVAAQGCGSPALFGSFEVRTHLGTYSLSLRLSLSRQKLTSQFIILTGKILLYEVHISLCRSLRWGVLLQRSLCAPCSLVSLGDPKCLGKTKCLARDSGELITLLGFQ